MHLAMKQIFKKNRNEFDDFVSSVISRNDRERRNETSPTQMQFCHSMTNSSRFESTGFFSQANYFASYLVENVEVVSSLRLMMA